MSLSHPDNMTFKHHVLKGEQEQLQYYNEKSNMIQMQQDQLLINLSIKQIMVNWSQTFVNILTDITSGKVNDVNDLIIILFKEDRMIYIGLTLIIVAFGIYIVDLTG